MKELELSSVAIEEMTDSQLQEIEGGIFWLLPFLGGALAGGMIYDIINDPEGCLESFNKGRNSARN